MAAFWRNNALTMATNLMKTLTGSSRNLSGIVSSEVSTSNTQKWMQDTSKKSPMELINEVPPIKVEDRIAVCVSHLFDFTTDSNPALGHPIEFICLEKDEPAVCKYCGLRYVQDHHH
ncbi:NADH dehydrogenase [ubiquinone] iron-sulfur protein 6, mitochondrial-like [Salvia splendens]|uniref:NADH dehydrogenase [ubiquinone] iron-sulfur protein 6, mitochondrial-like n=1 Tax=Salvia splendens TaxID=180675 RepID=UPI001C26C740|nr:NADH dehydrogenase [ubiquinone] iron-sulfur protein 6, mitochondrial-like [Salvia splendens]